MDYRTITAPATEPISLSEVKEDLRVNHTLDDARLTRHIIEAREFIERRIQMALITQTREVDLTSFPDEAIVLSNHRPVTSIVSIVYKLAGTPATVDSGDYELRGDTIFPFDTWPDESELVTVRFVAGYANAAAVPSNIKAAIRLKVAELYDGVNKSGAIDAILHSHFLMVA